MSGWMAKDDEKFVTTEMSVVRNDENEKSDLNVVKSNEMLVKNAVKLSKNHEEKFAEMSEWTVNHLAEMMSDVKTELIVDLRLNDEWKMNEELLDKTLELMLIDVYSAIRNNVEMSEVNSKIALNTVKLNEMHAKSAVKSNQNHEEKLDENSVWHRKHHDESMNVVQLALKLDQKPNVAWKINDETPELMPKDNAKFVTPKMSDALIESTVDLRLNDAWKMNEEILVVTPEWTLNELTFVTRKNDANAKSDAGNDFQTIVAMNVML